MKKGLILTLILFSLAACTKKKGNSAQRSAARVEESEESASLTDLKDKFKYSDLLAFELDTFSWETRPSHYNELDSSTFKLVWQDGKRNFIEQGFDRDYFYSWQKRNSKFIEFAILTQDESSSCDLLKYCIYDRNGKALDNFILAASCGDGGWGYQSSGKFISNDTYEEVSIETESEIVAAEVNKEIIEGDSTITHFMIGRTGKVTKKVVAKMSFRKEL